MKLKEFTPEEVVELKKSPYVKSVSEKSVRFNVAFKEAFWERYQEGMTPRAILEELGISPEILGTPRVYGIVRRIKETVENGEAFRDVNRPSVLTDETIEFKPSHALERMMHEVAYLKQEIEFIKKIILADREARRRCSSKRNRP